jgi:predicted chitinase
MFLTIVVKKPSKEEDAFAQRARGAATEFGKLGITNPIAIQAALQVAGKESNINQVSELGAKAWGNTVEKRGADYANGIFHRNFTKEQYLEAAKKGDEYFFGPEFMNNYKGGWKYRGRGFFGLTHDYNYKQVGELIGEDIYSNPDLVNRDSKINAKASLAVLALSLGRGNYKKGIEILNNFKDKSEALKFITANIAAGGTGLNANAKVFDEKHFKMNLEKAEKFESAVSGALGNATPAEIPKSAGGEIDKTSSENSNAKADGKAAQNNTTNNYSNQSQQNKKSSPQDKKVDDRPAYTKKANQ